MEEFDSAVKKSRRWVAPTRVVGVRMPFELKTGREASMEWPLHVDEKPASIRRRGGGPFKSEGGKQALGTDSEHRHIP